MSIPRASFATCLALALLFGCIDADQSSGNGDDGRPVRSIAADDYYDKVHGAWLGAAVAGALGMSVEGMHKNDLKPYLTELGQWPLTDYVKRLPPHRDPERKQWYTAEDWGPAGFGPDDDTLYQVANLLLLEEKGPEITSQDIADKWLASFSVFEAQNCGRAVRVAERRLKEGIMPPESGQHEMGEFMGGQMKGEFWGLRPPRQSCRGGSIREARRRSRIPYRRHLRRDVHGGPDRRGLLRVRPRETAPGGPRRDSRRL